MTKQMKQQEINFDAKHVFIFLGLGSNFDINVLKVSDESFTSSRPKIEPVHTVKVIFVHLSLYFIGAYLCCIYFVQNEMKGDTGSPGLKGEKGEPGSGYYDPRYGGSGFPGHPGPPVILCLCLW